jgi:hypothetical protein
MAFVNFSLASKKIIVTKLICFFWLIAKAISWKAWLADRLFPVVPPFNFLFVPSAVHLVLFILSLLALCALLLFPVNRILLVSVLIIEILSCLLDQNRWQPWEYQYIFIMLASVINYKNEKSAVSVIAFIFISVYFFSGSGKINPVFAISTHSKIVHSGIFPASNSVAYNWVEYHIGYAFGVIEVLLSIGLLFQPFKKISAIFLILMHLLILAVFGPFGLNYDRIIWPWNIMMMLILYLFFISDITVSVSFQSIKFGWNKLIIVLFGILPILNFFGYWDFYLSASLFSSKPPDMYIYIHRPGSSQVLHPFFTDHKNEILNDSTSAINVRAWSFREMEVPAYPEMRIYKSIREQLLKRYPDMNATFVVYFYIHGRKIRTVLN